MSCRAGAPEEVIVKVRDTECGIPSEHLETIYTSFFTTKGDKETGIGLWVVKGIVERLGGKISVESSTTGRTGTCFTIVFAIE
jgi:signal transduction histidine kinase